ncbi:MAG: hypothetical protein D6781_04060 [Verrucomicrobia bacterium]|nr:MAG: hypothetical protein D6781_04060 [Verrucomicrobiota bacterium]
MQRARQRLRWREVTLRRMVDRVFCFGIGPESVRGAVRRYLTNRVVRDEGIVPRIYGEHLYIFRADKVDPGCFALVTVYPLPCEYRVRLRRAFDARCRAA